MLKQAANLDFHILRSILKCLYTYLGICFITKFFVKRYFNKLQENDLSVNDIYVYTVCTHNIHTYTCLYVIYIYVY